MSKAEQGSILNLMIFLKKYALISSEYCVAFCGTGCFTVDRRQGFGNPFRLPIKTQFYFIVETIHPTKRLRWNRGKRDFPPIEHGFKASVLVICHEHMLQNLSYCVYFFSGL